MELEHRFLNKNTFFIQSLFLVLPENFLAVVTQNSFQNNRKVCCDLKVETKLLFFEKRTHLMILSLKFFTNVHFKYSIQVCLSRQNYHRARTNFGILQATKSKRYMSPSIIVREVQGAQRRVSRALGGKHGSTSTVVQ